MTFPALKEHLKALPCGKKLNHTLYITEESLETVNSRVYKFVTDLKIRVEAGSEYNIIKFFTNEFKISWLSYPDFFDDPHPGLKKSLTLNDDLRGLSGLGYNCSGWDPVHKQDSKKIKADVVNVGLS